MGQFNIEQTHEGECYLYIGVAIPAAGAEITLTADGKPDPTENPLAKLMGLSTDGVTTTITKSTKDKNFDEFKAPLESSIDQTGMTMKTTRAQILDMDVLLAALAGVGTAQTVAGKKKITLGQSAINKASIVAISPQSYDRTKFLVSHMYAGHNVSNVDILMSGKNPAGIPLEFRGSEVPTRAKDDTLGQIWFNE